jgi:hypothetical protein
MIIPVFPPARFQPPQSKYNLTLESKTEIQALVKIALTPHYQTNEINSEQYRNINRDVSRVLYEKVGTGAGLIEKEKWQKVATEEVKRAIQALG